MKPEQAKQYINNRYPETMGYEFDEVSDKMVSINYQGSYGVLDDIKDIPCRFELDLDTLNTPNTPILYHFINNERDFSISLDDWEDFVE